MPIPILFMQVHGARLAVAQAILEYTGRYFKEVPIEALDRLKVRASRKPQENFLDQILRIAPVLDATFEVALQASPMALRKHAQCVALAQEGR
jgi:hypothetical protein